ncbi:MAG: hypothetical protein HQM00_13190 [Magnetococcales bacterium]|nr:hypothetical protein [Magnetococcales bacterium]
MAIIDYVGAWSGTYSGDDSGVWHHSIDLYGHISGTATSSIDGTITTLSGAIGSDGAMNMSASGVAQNLYFTATFNGQADLITRTITGTWENQSDWFHYSGTFAGAMSLSGDSDLIPATTATTATLAAGQNLSGTVDQGGDQDWYRLSLSAGSLYTFTQVADTASSLDSLLRLLDASGSLILSDDNGGGGVNARLTYSPVASGTYYLSAGGSGSTTMGNYRLSVSTTTGSGDDNPYVGSWTGTYAGDDAGVWSYVVDASGHLTGTAASYFGGSATLSGTVGLDGALTMTSGTATSENGATYFSGQSDLATRTTSGTWFNPYDSYSGTYSGALTSSGTSDLVPGSTATTATLAVGQSVSGTVDTTPDQDWYRVSLTAGVIYTFNQVKSVGSTLDGYLRLMNASGTQIAGNNDGGGDRNPRIVYTPTASGNYFLAAGALQSSGSRGGFTLSIEESGMMLVESAVTRTLGPRDHDLTLTGSASIDGTGNALANFITGNTGSNTLRGEAGDDTLYGNSGNDLLYGGDDDDYLRGGTGDDRLYGGDGIDTLYGSSGNDYLSGGSGGDLLIGGSGDDSYVVGSSSDAITEDPDAGIDLVSSALSWTLGDNQEKLTLTGSGAYSGTGNTLANTLRGNDAANTLRGLSGADLLYGEGGNDRLIGGSGADRLTGGSGADQFQWLSRSEGGDTITDFSASQGDRLVFVSSAFNNLATGPLSSTRFRASSSGAANSTSQRFLFNTTTGVLKFDPDGTGSSAAVTIATLSRVTSLSASHIVLASS